MRNVAFKRAKNCLAVSYSLHPEFITEYAFTDLFDKDFHRPELGYEILDEEQFNQELAKNTERHEQFQQVKRDLELAMQAAQSAEQIEKDKQEKIANREFEEFLKWKANRSKK